MVRVKRVWSSGVRRRGKGKESEVFLATGYGTITTTNGIKGGSARLTDFLLCHGPTMPCSISHPILFQKFDDWPQFEYSRQPDTAMRVHMQNKGDALFDGPAARRIEDMVDHAEGLDRGPALRNPRQTAHISAAQKRQAFGVGKDPAHVLIDLVKDLQHGVKYGPNPKVML